jgi:hypothetical protein
MRGNGIKGREVSIKVERDDLGGVLPEFILRHWGLIIIILHLPSW